MPRKPTATPTASATPTPTTPSTISSPSPRTMKVCILQSSYSHSSSSFADVDFPVKPELWLSQMPGFECVSLLVSKSNFIHKLITEIQSGAELFINLCDGASDEDRAGIEVIAALERLNVPYTGANVVFYEPSREEMKMVARANGVPTPEFEFVFNMDRDWPKLQQAVIDGRLVFPLIVKHYNSYGSIALKKDCKVHTMEDLKDRVERFTQGFGGCLVEQFVGGTEYTVLIVALADGGYHVYPAAECMFSNGEDFKHFDLKYADSANPDIGSILWLPCADDKVNQKLSDASKTIFSSLYGRGYARLDFRRDDETEELYFLEINPNCGIFYEQGADQASADYIIQFDDPINGHKIFLQRIIDYAIAEHQAKISTEKMLPATRLMNPDLHNPRPEIPTLSDVNDIVQIVRGPEFSKTTTRSWTVIIWTLVPNDLQIGAWKDLAKLTQYPASSDVAVHMLIETNDTGTWRLRLNGDAREMGSLNLLRQTDLDTTDCNILSEFIRDAAIIDPAERYMVVLQGHGFGWYMRYDDQGTILPLDSFRDALLAANVPISILGLDACCLGTIEMLECLSPTAEVILACEGYCPWDGLVSGKFLRRLEKGKNLENVELAKSLIKDFVKQQPDPETPASSQFDEAAPADMALYLTSKLKPFLEFLVELTIESRHFIVDAAVDEINTESAYLTKQPLELQVHSIKKFPSMASSNFDSATLVQRNLQKKYSILYDLHAVVTLALERERPELYRRFIQLFNDLVVFHGTNNLYQDRFPLHRGLAFVRSYNATLPMSLGTDAHVLAAWSYRPERLFNPQESEDDHLDSHKVQRVKEFVEAHLEDTLPEAISDIKILVEDAEKLVAEEV